MIMADPTNATDIIEKMRDEYRAELKALEVA
jgi:hypothetical protein